MSKTSDYNMSAKEDALNKVEFLANMAIQGKDMYIWVQCVKYAEGLRDAYDAYMDSEAVSALDDLLDAKTEEVTKAFVKRMKEELN
jgi:hypothetical protein